MNVQQAAVDLVASLRERGYGLTRMPREDVSIWSTRSCLDHPGCDLTISVVDSSEPSSIEAEFVRRPARCHAEVAAFRVTTARVFDTWILPESVVRSSTPDRASAGPCWWILSERSFVPREGVSLRGAAADLVAALREQGYRLRRSGDETLTYWDASGCPDYSGCSLAIWVVDYEDSPLLEAEFLR